MKKKNFYLLIFLSLLTLLMVFPSCKRESSANTLILNSTDDQQINEESDSSDSSDDISENESELPTIFGSPSVDVELSIEQKPSPINFCPGNSYIDLTQTPSQCTNGKPILFIRDKLTLKSTSYLLADLMEDKIKRVCLFINKVRDRASLFFLIHEIQNQFYYVINQWFEPLRQKKLFKEIFTAKKIPFFVNDYSKCKTKNGIKRQGDQITLYYFNSDENIPCNIQDNDGLYGCANLEDRTIFLRGKKTDEDDVERPYKHVFVHEFGHLLGFDDLYHKENLNQCLDGYDITTTVMCLSNTTLKPADQEGVILLYCSFYPQNINCQYTLQHQQVLQSIAYSRDEIDQ